MYVWIIEMIKKKKQIYLLPLFVAAFRSNSTTNDMTICCLIVNKPKIPIPYWEKIIAYTVAENRSQIGTNVNGRHPKKTKVLEGKRKSFVVGGWRGPDPRTSWMHGQARCLEKETVSQSQNSLPLASLSLLFSKRANAKQKGKTFPKLQFATATRLIIVKSVCVAYVFLSLKLWKPQPLHSRYGLATQNILFKRCILNTHICFLQLCASNFYNFMWKVGIQSLEEHFYD